MKMKRSAAMPVMVGLVLLLGHGNAVAGNGVGSLAKNKAYSVQVIAHDSCPAGSFDDTSRRTIAVKAGFTDSIPDGTLLKDVIKTNKIFLAPGTNFSIMDGNACDDDGARMILPLDVSTTYEVYVRLVGQPGSKIDVSTCAVDTTGVVTGTANAVLCSTNHLVKMRLTGKGEPSFQNATSELLTITNPLLCAGTCPIFAAGYLDYFWDWNTPLGRPHAQLWFVPVPDTAGR
jgi:hypothetical protein